ncbi:hypothetical protein Pmani_012367 [Petrolisthes manimaculis]|uniref:Uncharacterized protein n=1 Tax=Petrolisthes manimaculis TaxID=1843537 RepID=A0AAE1PZ38_9EUCA|nr:hypothetical protein Pmani_012367 [Petrolisthes manimaculis]
MGKETETEPWKRRPKREDSNVPVFYMPGGPKKTRDCAMVNGLLGGFNTFNYLTFVTGLITLVLNVVIFPPGRKRRSLTDWLLVLLAPSSNSPVPEPQSLPHTTTKKHQGTKSETRLASSAGTELTTTLFTLLYAWIQGGLDDSVEGGDVRCSWVKYCRVLDHLDIHHPLLAPYIRSFSQKVSPKWLSSLTCHYLYAICPS